MRPLRVCSFNVRYDTPADEPHDWAARRDVVVETIRDIDPDVLCVQEALFHQLVDLESRLPAFDWWGQGRRGGTEGEYVPIAWRHEILRFRDGAVRWLSPDPGEPESVGWDADLPRVATGVRLSSGGTPIAIWNTHLSHVGDRARLRAAQLLTDWLGGESPLVLAGDFNCGPGSDPYRHLTSVFTDTRAVAQETAGPVGTFTQFTGEPGPAIDHIFVTDDVTVERFAVVSHGDADPPVSDHYPVVADLRLPAVD